MWIRRLVFKLAWQSVIVQRLALGGLWFGAKKLKWPLKMWKRKTEDCEGAASGRNKTQSLEGDSGAALYPPQRPSPICFIPPRTTSFGLVFPSVQISSLMITSSIGRLLRCSFSFLFPECISFSKHLLAKYRILVWLFVFNNLEIFAISDEKSAGTPITIALNIIYHFSLVTFKVIHFHIYPA